MFYLYGASGHAKVIVDSILSTGKTISGIFDDDDRKKSTFPEIDFFGSYHKNHDLKTNAKFLISIGNNKIRQNISRIITQEFFSINHSSSIISSSVCIGIGTVVMPNAVINANAKIGNHCIINTSATIEHDCIIGDFVHVSPNATITGNVKIGIGSFIGANSVVLPGVTIGKWATIGAGSVIINNIPDNAVVVGNPGKIIRYNEK